MTPTALRTSAEHVGKDRIKLRVEVSEDALGPALRATYRRWANEMKVPGFRRGKVPRQIIDSRVGADVVRAEAVKEAIPSLFREALAAEDLEAISAPEIELLELTGSPVVFEATVDLRPEIRLPSLDSIRVDAPDAAVTDADIDEHLERLRDRFAELETVGREARRGDFALIDLKGYSNGEPVEGSSAPDLLYEIGSATGPPKLDQELEGTRPGAILRFNDVVPDGAQAAGQEISFTVLVKEIKAKRLPALDDEFAKTAGEFDTLDELRDDLRSRLGDVKRGLIEEHIARLCLEALVDASDLEAPERLVDDEFDHRLEHFEDELTRAGMTMNDYARRSDSTELEIRSDIRNQAARSVKAELLLEQIAREQEIDVTQQDLARDIATLAVQAQRDPKDVAKQLAGTGSLSAVAADIMRRKALEYVVQNVNVVGRPMDAGSEDEEDRRPMDAGNQDGEEQGG
jgi:trigger factor